MPATGRSVVEPLSAERLHALADDVSPHANGWVVYETGCVDDPDGYERCVEIDYNASNRGFFFGAGPIDREAERAILRLSVYLMAETDPDGLDELAAPDPE